jgi:putative transposase
MPQYRRWKIEGGMFFLTVVVHERRPLFGEAANRRLLREAITEAQARRPFEITATVLLPDHLHALWQLPEGDAGFSCRMRGVKHGFTRAYLAAGGVEGASSPGRARHRCRGVWQKRFHEHFIRDDTDLQRHLDYILYNPVKHGYVDSPAKWRWSSFQRYVKLGLYPADWCDPGRASQFGMDPGFE